MPSAGNVYQMQGQQSGIGQLLPALMTAYMLMQGQQKPPQPIMGLPAPQVQFNPSQGIGDYFNMPQQPTMNMNQPMGLQIGGAGAFGGGNDPLLDAYKRRFLQNGISF